VILQALVARQEGQAPLPRLELTIVRFPAPLRSAAIAARIAPPAICGEPATMSTAPRDSLSPSSGEGSGHRASRRAVKSSPPRGRDGPARPAGDRSRPEGAIRARAVVIRERDIVE